MDHLPRIKDFVQPPEDVPYLCKEEYDGQAFTGYPQRRGWDKDLFTNGRYEEFYTQKSAEETASFLQAWLFFGVLTEVLEISVKIEDFVSENGTGELVIRTKLLPKYMEDWQHRTQCLSENEKKERLSEVEACLSEASAFANFPCALKEDRLWLSCWPGGLAESIMVLLSTLHFGSRGVFGLEGDLYYQNRRDVGLGECDHTISRMVKAGWCPNTIARLKGRLMPTGMYFASFLRRFQCGKDHSRCSRQECVVNQVDEKHYRTMHTKADCTCEHLEPPYGKISSILRNGGIPVIKVYTVQSTEVLLDVDDYQSGLPYVAISHVWSDGLGNVQKNSLPKCQLLRLGHLVRNSIKQVNWPGMDDKPLFGPFGLEISFVVLWIDTICVPIETDLRKLAISRMSKTYEAAAMVLVLDSELQQSSCNNSQEECLARIACSGWMQRIWTLQEAFSAQVVAVQFMDGVLEVDSAAIQLQLTSSSSPYPTVPGELAVVILGIRQIKYADSMCLRLALAWNVMQGRSTSKRGDEIICLASMLGLDAGALFDTPAEQSMKKFYSMQEEIPQGILFSGGKKINECGYRWADVSAIGSGITSAAPAPRNEVGLTVTYPGLLVRLASASVPYFFFESPSGEQWLKVTYSDELRPPTEPATGLVGIIEQQDTDLGDLLPCGIRVVVVTFDKPASDLITARIQGYATLEVADERDTELLGMQLLYRAVREVGPDGIGKAFGRGLELPPSQRWCLG